MSFPSHSCPLYDLYMVVIRSPLTSTGIPSSKRLDHQSPETSPRRVVYFRCRFFPLHQTSDTQLIDININVHVCLVIFSASNGTYDKVPSFYHISSFPSIYTIAYSYTSVGMTHGSDVIVGCVLKQPHPEVIDFSKRTQWFDQGQQ